MKLTPSLLSSSNFAAFGELVAASHEDVKLDLSKGSSRFYVTQREKTGLASETLMRHRTATICLGNMAGRGWYIVVAGTSETELEKDDAVPDASNLKAFYVPGDKGIKLNRGVWHSGPLWDTSDRMPFFHLELQDTQEKDTHKSTVTGFSVAHFTEFDDSDDEGDDGKHHHLRSPRKHAAQLLAEAEAEAHKEKVRQANEETQKLKQIWEDSHNQQVRHIRGQSFARPLPLRPGQAS